MKLSRQSQYNDMNITEQILKYYSNKSKFEKLILSHCELSYECGDMRPPKFFFLREVYMTNITMLSKPIKIGTNGWSIMDNNNVINLPPFLEKFTLRFEKSGHHLPITFKFSSCEFLSYFEITRTSEYFGNIKILFAPNLTCLRTFIMNGNMGQIQFRFGISPIMWYSGLEKIHVSPNSDLSFLKLVDGQYELDKEKCPKCTEFTLIPSDVSTPSVML